MIDDAQIRQLMIKALPSLIDPAKLEVEMLDYDSCAGYWYRGPLGTLHGRAVAIQRSELEIAAELAADLGSLFIVDALNADISPYEGKAGRHPDTCSCSKHKAVSGH